MVRRFCLMLKKEKKLSILSYLIKLIRNVTSKLCTMLCLEKKNQGLNLLGKWPVWIPVWVAIELNVTFLLLLIMSCSGETNTFNVQNCFFQLSSKAGYTAVYITVNVSSKIACLWRQTLGHLVAVVLLIRVLGH